MPQGTRLWNRGGSRCLRRLRCNAVRSGHLQLEDGTKAGWRTTSSRPLISRIAARPAGCGEKPAKARIELRVEAALHSFISRGRAKQGTNVRCCPPTEPLCGGQSLAPSDRHTGTQTRGYPVVASLRAFAKTRGTDFSAACQVLAYAQSPPSWPNLES